VANNLRLDEMTLSEIESLIREQVDRMAKSDDAADTEAQLAELNAAIARLEAQDIQVPDSLREVKLSLTRKSSEVRSASDVLEEVRSRLVDLVRMMPDGAITASILGTADGTIDLPELRINIAERRVTVQEEDVRLTPKEFALLLYLVSAPNVVHSREDIMAELWEGTSRATNVRTVDTHVKRLRTKLEEGRSVPWKIDTVWGVGYTFVVDRAHIASRQWRAGGPPDGPAG